MGEDILQESFKRVNERFFQGTLRESAYQLEWRELSGTYGRVVYRRDSALILVHARLRDDAELSDYVMLHELLHTVPGFRGLRGHRGKFNGRLRELLGAGEFLRLEGRLRAVDIKKRVFRRRFVYECPSCGTRITRKKRVKYASCARCDSEYNPKYMLKLTDIYSALN